jgi:hypothetical protein
VSELQSSGIDRSELSFLAHLSPTGRPPSDLRRAVEDSREPAISDTDLRQRRVVGTGLAATIAAFAAPGFTVAIGGVAAAVTVAGPGSSRQCWSCEHSYRTQTRRRPDVVPRRAARAAACFYGCVHGMLPAKKQCSKCSGGIRRMCTSMTYQLKLRRFIRRLEIQLFTRRLEMQST